MVEVVNLLLLLGLVREEPLRPAEIVDAEAEEGVEVGGNLEVVRPGPDGGTAAGLDTLGPREPRVPRGELAVDAGLAFCDLEVGKGHEDVGSVCGCRIGIALVRPAGEEVRVHVVRIPVFRLESFRMSGTARYGGSVSCAIQHTTMPWFVCFYVLDYYSSRSAPCTYPPDERYGSFRKQYMKPVTCARALPV